MTACGGGGDDSAPATDGKGIFLSAGCGDCHTLEAAGTDGTVGPNLNRAAPSEREAVTTVTEGRGVMPSFEDQLSDRQIQTVARFVAESTP